MYCIQETDKPKLLYKIFNHIELDGNKIILPINCEKKLSPFSSEQLVKKIEKFFDKTMCKRIIISKKIKEQEWLINLLHTLGKIEIVDGKWLFEVLSLKIFDYLIIKKELKKEEVRVSILVNDLSENMLEAIKIIAKEYKKVNIITNHIEKFKKIEKQILKEEGSILAIGNNKKKGLSKSNIILNIDFPSELVNKYNIYEKAYIISINENIKIEKKKFEGICIKDYDIEFRNLKEIDKEIQEKFKICEFYEAQINKKQSFKELMKQIQKDGVRITKLFGNHYIL